MCQAETKVFFPRSLLEKDTFEVSTNMAFATNKPMRSLNKAGNTSRFSAFREKRARLMELRL